MALGRRTLYSLCGLMSAVLFIGLAAGGYLSFTKSGLSRERSQPAESSLKSEDKHGAGSALSQAARKYIWDTEQRAFQIMYKAAPALTDALCRGDRSALLDFFHTDFQGRVVAAESVEIVARGFAEFRYQRAGDVAADREQFVDWLLEQARLFRSAPQAQLPLLYLSPVQPDHMDGPWQGTWILRLFGETAEGSPGEVVVRGKFGADELPKDFARDRGWIKSWEVENAVVARSNRILMEEVSARTGIDVGRLHDNWVASRTEFTGTTGGVYACDYNNDGVVDLLITDKGKATLYAGRGSGKFEDVTVEAGLPVEETQAIVACFADLDNDGDEDLILGSRVFENRGGYFVRRGYLPLLPEANSITVADYDRDGFVDLYVSNAAPPPRRAAGRTSWVDDHSGIPNQLFRNLGNFRFEDVTERAGASAGQRSTFTSVWLDADDDGWPDLYVINELGSNVLLHNERNGTFTEHHIGPEPDGFAMGVAAGDVDGDGKIDIYIGNMYSKAGQRIIANIPADAYPSELIQRMKGFVAGNLLLLNKSNLKFESSGNSMIAGVGWAYGPALVDLDGDGLLDIHSTAGFASFSRKEPDG